MNQHKISEVLADVKSKFELANKQEAEVDAKWLLAELMGCSLTEIMLIQEKTLSEETYLSYMNHIQRRLAGEPLQHILGYQNFYGYDFKVNGNVLIPRFETEELVEKGISLIKENRMKQVIDMCSGSGCIGITLLKECAEIKAYCVDVSYEAISIAHENGLDLGVNNRLTFYKSDLFIEVPQMNVDMIISNPPYIPSDIIYSLSTEVKDQEPSLALDGGTDGLDFYRRIIVEGKPYLKKGGYLLFEIGHNQMEAVLSLMEESEYKNVKGYKDLSGNDRMIIGQK
ncbi:peptide chain release factor N(5)-glutamine methyltransferase [Petrocella sp. FN5]|uniref:peptide chain release factor N(5)-glutamine methyltransferase n=1 Tax=Petrocella sp. FN5 TaxID=3032002 RepID=UPI0023D97DB6|nr:peptide chain release factor N(5)-glutamine methyltransferase [Petrocella sp. FN5]MDF1617870.1 peptide chain release factor N(5)-glutamine methyltransferase [Petrocella sp. FN5]